MVLENNREEESLKKLLTKEMDSIKVPTGLKEEMWTQLKPLRKKKKFNLKVVFPYIATVACFTILIALGLSGEFPFNSDPTPSDTVTTQDENIQTIEAVLQKALNGPSDELKEMSKRSGLEEEVKYDESLFKEHFANVTSYMGFVNSYGIVLMNAPLREGYQLKVNSIEYEKSESEELIYDFTVELMYQKEGSDSWEVETISGEANLNKDHKIENMVIRIDEFLGSLGQ